MIDVLLKLGGLQAFLLALFLFRRKTNNYANRILAVLVFLLGVTCIIYSFNNLEFYLKFPHLIRSDWGIPLLFGPLLYLYVRSLINSKTSFSEKDYGHFVPYVIHLMILSPFFIKSSEEKIQILNYFTASLSGGTDGYYYYNLILRMIIASISFSYAYESIKIVKTYSSTLLNEYSNTEKLKLNWLRTLLYSFMILSVIFVLTTIVTFGDRYPQFDYNIYYVFFVFVFIYILSYKTLSQPKIVAFNDLETEKKVTSTKTPPKEVSDLSNEAELIKEFMTTQKPYLNGELTATELAEQLQLSRHRLSLILNEALDQNFYDFINQYRVEEFMNRVNSPENDHLTLLGIAFDAGFNSKTTFNTIFKKATGLTPSQYKKNIQ